jgi:tRNA G37 N-methylase Trm5
MTDKQRYALIDLFAGTGAFSYAGLKTGRIVPVYSCDIEQCSIRI